MKVALDIDGVIGNFYKAACKFYNKPYVQLSEYNPEWIRNKRFEIAKIDEIWRNIPVLNKAEDIDFQFDLYLTSVPFSMIDVRKKWLLEKGFPIRPLIATKKKLIACKELGVDILIDDKVSTIEECVKDGSVITIQFLPPYMKEGSVKFVGDYFTDSIQDIKPILESLNEKE